MSLFVSIEVRPRLGAANVFIKGKGIAPSVIDVSGGKVVFGGNGGGFHWPVSLTEEGFVPDFSKAGCSGSEGEVTARLVKSKGQGLTLIPRQDPAELLESLAGRKGRTERPEWLPKEGSESSLICSKCGAKISPNEIKVSRVLMLPSGHWKDLSGEWFCMCCPGNKDMCKEEEKNEQQPQQPQQHAPSNRKLTATTLSPKNGDLLWSPGFFVLGKGQTCGVSTAGDEAKCEGCGSTLGLRSSQDGTLQLWFHSVRFEQCQDAGSEFTAGDTFVELFNCALDESLERTPRIRFRSGGSKSLLVWGIERDLVVYHGHNDGSSTFELEKDNMAKCLFKMEIARPNEKDEDKSSIVSVSDDLILAGEKYLRDFQTRHIPGTFRRDGDWEVSLVPKGIRKKQ